jgi:hypothetical protein
MVELSPRRTSNVSAGFRNPGRRSAGLRIRVIDVRPPERWEVPAEVQFEVARNAVTDITNPGTARVRTGQGRIFFSLVKNPTAAI